MIPEIGFYCLILALVVACLQSSLPLIGSYKSNMTFMQMGKSTAIAMLCLTGIAFFCLANALVTNDFSVAYVVQNSNTHLPTFYRFCALWGAHEGSLLLWVFILSIWMSLVSMFSRNLPLEVQARVLSVLGMISVGFLLFLLLTSNPFSRLLPTIPQEGRDLNPLLQDPGLAIHPPMLYMGYVGFSVAFALAIAGLLSKRVDAMWAKWARPWTLVAWSFLTLGIILGSWWAYRVLGWGGWWFWDPVENASFLPWLIATGLIHSLAVAEKRDTFKGWTILLAIFTFSLSLMGTFLVRSGILVSVHAFAVDPLRGAFMLKFLAVVIGASLLLYALRGSKIKNQGQFSFWSRETLLLSNNVLLTVAMLTVLLGTLYPLIIDALGWGKLSVGPPYFNSVFLPLILPVLFLMGIGPAFTWQRADIKKIIKNFRFSFVLSFVLAMFLPYIFTQQIHWYLVLGLGLAFWIILATFQNARFSIGRNGMFFAHIGFAICTIGIVASEAFSVQKDVRMHPGDIVALGPYQFQFFGTHSIAGSNFQADEAQVRVTKRNEYIVTLHPQLRIYQTQNMGIAKTSIHATPFRDLYVALGEPLVNNDWSLRIYYKPFIRWIWAGGIIMLIGGLISATHSRYRMPQDKR